MLAKKLIVLSTLALLNTICLATNRFSGFELTIQPNQETNQQAGALTVEIYNGYELVIAETMQAGAPVHITLNLYCNYVLVVKKNGRETFRYRISTEVPPKIEKEWKVVVYLPSVTSNNEEAPSELAIANIRYQENQRTFEVVENKSPMAEETTNKSTEIKSYNRTN